MVSSKRDMIRFVSWKAHSNSHMEDGLESSDTEVGRGSQLEGCWNDADKKRGKPDKSVEEEIGGS